MAPVDVDAVLRAGSATVTLKFLDAGEKVRAQVSGLDGLTVTSAPSLISDAQVKGAEQRSSDVTFTPGPGRSHLVVTIQGVFHGAPLARVVTFAIGDGATTTPGQKIQTSDGESIKVMP